MTRGERNIAWIERYCYVPEGKLAGQPVRLLPFQQDIIKRIYDNPNNTRRAIISMGRKNAKTALTAMLLLLHTVGPEANPNAQLYSAAQSRDQAAILFGYAATMARMSPELSSELQIKDSYKKIICPELGTRYQALSAEATTAHGLSPVFMVHDELGQVVGPVSPLYDALETGSGAHENPLSVVISTQAADNGDLLSTLIDDAQSLQDPRTVLIMYSAAMDDDPFTIETIRKANPAAGVFLNEAELIDQAETAKRMASAESRYRNLVLNQRVSRDALFVSNSVWESNDGEPDESVFYDYPVYIGLDLSSHKDLTCIVMLATDKDGIDHVKPFFFAPGDGINERMKRDRAPYAPWADAGLIELTPGKTVDYAYVAHKIVELWVKYNVEEIDFDPWHIRMLEREIEQISATQLPMKKYGQGYKDMSPALTALQSTLENGRLRHGSHPILNWCASNAVVVVNHHDQAMKLSKIRSSGRIDGMVALAIAKGAQARASEPAVIQYIDGGMFASATT